MKPAVPAIKKYANPIKRFYGLFYAQEKIDAFDARLNAVADVTDVGEKLMAYHALAAELPASKLSRRGKVALWGCGALMLGGSSVAAAMPPLAFLTSFLGAPAFLMVMGGITAFHAIMGDFSIASPAFQQFDKAGRLKNETAARTTLEDLRRSSQIDAVLTAYPALKERFAEEATRAAIKGQVAAALPAPEARVMPQKSAVPLRRNIEV